MSRLVITPGDPRGVGPEVTAAALAERQQRGEAVDAVLVGDGVALQRAAAMHGLAVWLADSLDASTAHGVPIVDPGDVGEPVEVKALRVAVAGIAAGQVSALVTGPIHKARLRARGFRFTGHTDFLGDLCGAKPVMAFAGGKLRVALVTVHLPLSRVPAAITQEAVTHVLHTAHRALREQLGIPSPRLVVCGLNPHAGEDGELGTEERDVIRPAVLAAVREGLNLVGPISAEAAVRMAYDGRADLMVAMYHDQGLAPLKLVDFGRSVNWTLGLPIIRTSVDHGTADDIAWTGTADASSMHAAIRLAETLVARSEPC